MNTILYIRQSKDSNDPEASLAGQEFECKLAADSTPGMEITKILRDTITGTLTIAEREAGRQLLSAIRERECEAILLPSVDRLSRDTWGAEDLQLLINLLKGSGILWYFADNKILSGELTPFDYEDDTQILAVQAQLQASALERINIAKRTMRKKRAMLAEGQLVMTGKPPFGYHEEKTIEGNKVKREWIIEPSHALIVKRIYTLYSEGSQVQEIVKVLNSEGASTPGAYPWNTSAIYRILSHEIYKGIFVWGKFEHNKKAGTKILREIGNPNRFDLEREEFRIVSTEVWERVQVLAKQNRTVRAKHDYLLSGILYCGECGKLYQGKAGKYYRCASTKDKGHSCGNGSIRKDDFENDIWGAIVHLGNNPTELYKLIWDSIEKGSTTQVKLQEQIEGARKHIATKNRQIDNITGAVSRAESERVIIALLKQADNLGSELTALEQELTALEASVTTIEVDNDTVAKIVYNVQGALEGEHDYQTKRNILAELGVKVIKYSQVQEQVIGAGSLVVLKDKIYSVMLNLGYSVSGVSCNPTKGVPRITVSI